MAYIFPVVYKTSLICDGIRSKCSFSASLLAKHSSLLQSTSFMDLILIFSLLVAWMFYVTPGMLLYFSQNITSFDVAFPILSLMNYL